MPVRNREKVICDWCSQEFEKWPSQVKKYNFCCRKCLAIYVFPSQSEHAKYRIRLNAFFNSEGGDAK
jgi:hypothetical protein